MANGVDSALETRWDALNAPRKHDVKSGGGRARGQVHNG